MKIENLIQSMEKEWDIDGFLGNLRQGIFNPSAGDDFLALLSTISIEENEFIPKRLLSLLWYLPLFLEWQRERVAEVSGERVSLYVRFITQVQNLLEQKLGVP